MKTREAEEFGEFRQFHATRVVSLTTSPEMNWHGGRSLASGQCKSLFLGSISLLLKSARSYSGSKVLQQQQKNGAEAAINLRKVLILNKITRYEFEKRRYPNLDESELKAQVRVLKKFRLSRFRLSAFLHLLGI